MEEVEKRVLLREGEETGKGEGEGGWGKKRDNKEWERSGSLERNRRALKAIYRPQGAGGGGAGSGTSAADTGITNNPTRHPVLLWSWAEGELLWHWCRYHPPISAIKDVPIPSFTQPRRWCCVAVNSSRLLKDTTANTAAVLPANNISCSYSIDSMLFCSDRQTCTALTHWEVNVHKTLHQSRTRPMAGAFDQCTGNSFASTSPRGDWSQENNTGDGAKCGAHSTARISLSLCAMIQLIYQKKG